MNLDQILELTKAGFSKEDIARIATANSAPPAPVVEAPAEVDKLAAITAKLDSLEKTLTASALAASQQPEEPSLEDLCAMIMAPPGSPNTPK